jgi:hypothetical protein
MGMGFMLVYCKFYPDIYSQADKRYLAKNTIIHRCVKPCTPQIRPNVTSSSSPKLRTPWKANAFKMW